MNTRPQLLALAALLTVGAALTSCGSVRALCSPSGLCAETPNETQPGSDAGLIDVRPGETRMVTVTVDLNGLPENTPLEFGSRMDTAAGNVLATFDGGRVVVRAPAPTFTAATAILSIETASDAKLTTDPGDYYTPDRVFTRKAQSQTTRVGSLTLTIRVSQK